MLNDKLVGTVPRSRQADGQVSATQPRRIHTPIISQAYIVPPNPRHCRVTRVLSGEVHRKGMLKRKRVFSLLSGRNGVCALCLTRSIHVNEREPEWH